MNIHLWHCYFEGFSCQTVVRRASLPPCLNKNRDRARSETKPSLSLVLPVDVDMFLSRVHPRRVHLHRHPRNDRALPSLRFHKSIEGKNVWNAGIVFGRVLSFPLKNVNTVLWGSGMFWIFTGTLWGGKHTLTWKAGKQMLACSNWILKIAEPWPPHSSVCVVFYFTKGGSGERLH